MVAIRLRENVTVHGVRVRSDGTLPVVASLAEDEQKRAEDLPFLAAWLDFVQSIGGAEEDFREMLRDADHFAEYADVDLTAGRDVLTFGEAQALVELGVAEPIGPDLDRLELEVERWRREASSPS